MTHKYYEHVYETGSDSSLAPHSFVETVKGEEPQINLQVRLSTLYKLPAIIMDYLRKLSK
jgi:hypothetical protein